MMRVIAGAFFSLTCGCAAVKPACLVIDAAHAACVVVTVPDGKGGTEEVRVAPGELVRAVRRVKAERATATEGASP